MILKIDRKSMRRLFLVFGIAIPAILSGCTPVIRPETPNLSGTFRGNTHDRQPATFTLIQKDNTLTGNGSIGGRLCSLSGITSHHGPVIMTFEDGKTVPATVTLSPDTDTAAIQGLDKPLLVSRGGEPVRAASGPFAGNFKAPGPPQIALTLNQGGKLLAGTGFIDGKPVAVVGKVTGANQAAGAVLFSDESRNAVKATLSGDGRVLTIRGLGGPIELRRE